MSELETRLKEIEERAEKAEQRNECESSISIVRPLVAALRLAVEQRDKIAATFECNCENQNEAIAALLTGKETK